MAQRFPSEIWHEGKLVLLDNDTLRGDIKYDLENNLIQIKSGKRVEAYSGRKILFFEIYDTTIGDYRQFYALPYDISGSNYRAPVLFEVLHEGKISLLTREAVQYQTINSGPTYFGGPRTRIVLVYDFYFLDNEGKIERFNKRKKDLLFYLRKKSNEIKKYIKDNNLKVDSKRDLARIIAYYNSLIST